MAVSINRSEFGAYGYSSDFYISPASGPTLQTLRPVFDALLPGGRLVISSASPRRQRMWAEVAGLVGINKVTIGDTSGYVEPKWDNPLATCRDKATHVVWGLLGKPGSPAMVVACDSTNIINGTVMHKLARETEIDAKALNDDLEKTVETFRGPTEVEWILATLVSMEKACFGWAGSLKGEFDPIPADFIKREYEQNLPKVRRLPNRLDLLGKTIAHTYLHPDMVIRDVTQELMKNGEILTQKVIHGLTAHRGKFNRICPHEALLGVFGGLPIGTGSMQQVSPISLG